MKERPIIFGAESIKAILSGAKTQTRRVVKWPNPVPNYLKCATDCKGVLFDKAFPDLLMGVTPGFHIPCLDGAAQRFRNPWGWPSTQTRLWVRETWRSYDLDGTLAGAKKTLRYRADREEAMITWKSPIHMPRWASRITLELTDVRAERLQDITEEGAKAEGVSEPAPVHGRWCDPARGREGHWSYRKPFSEGWDLLNKARGFGWDKNPWVWVLTFTPAPPPVE
jgi:hypothetical protein